jgi:hypothetical protein
VSRNRRQCRPFSDSRLNVGNLSGFIDVACQATPSADPGATNLDFCGFSGLSRYEVQKMLPDMQQLHVERVAELATFLRITLA